MKDNKNQPASSLVNNEFTITATPNHAKVVPLNNRYEVARQAPIQIKDENNLIIRRHSFDDNGGGYQGL